MLLALQYMTMNLLAGLVTNMQACEHHLTDEKDNVQYNCTRAGTLHRRDTLIHSLDSWLDYSMLESPLDATMFHLCGHILQLLGLFPIFSLNVLKGPT